MTTIKIEEITTNRLYLQKISKNNLESLYQNVFNDFNYYKYYFPHKFPDLATFKVIIESNQLLYNSNYFYYWVLINQKTNESIGVVQIHSIDSNDNSCKIGYIIGPNYQGQGYIKEALEAIIDFAFQKMHLNKIYSEIVIGNTPSINVAKSLGMHYHLTKKDSYTIANQSYDQDVYLLNKN